MWYSGYKLPRLVFVILFDQYYQFYGAAIQQTRSIPLAFIKLSLVIVSEIT